MRMAARLGQHPLAGVGQDDRRIGGRGAGGHVARVLLMAGGVGDDEAAPLGREIAIGYVDGDALFALGQQAVDQQGEVQRAVRIGQGGDLVVGHGADVMQQAADQRRLAVVHRAAGDEAQQIAVRGGR